MLLSSAIVLVIDLHDIDLSLEIRWSKQLSLILSSITGYVRRKCCAKTKEISVPMFSLFVFFIRLYIKKRGSSVCFV